MSLASANKPLRQLATQAWWLLPLLLVALLALAQSAPDIQQYRLHSAEIRACGATDAMPPRWPPRRRDVELGCVVLEYRITPDLAPHNAQGLAVLLVGAHQDVAIDLNGSRLRDAIPRDRRSHLLMPILLPIGSGLLQADDNRLRIEVRTHDRYDAPALLRSAHFGPAEALERWHRRHALLQEGGARATLVLMAAMLLFLLPIAIAGPTNPALRWYAISIVLASLYVAMFASSFRPAPLQLWDAVAIVSLALALAAYTRTSEIELGMPRRRAPWLLGLLAALLMFGSTLQATGSQWLQLNAGGRLILLALILGLGLRWWRGRHLSATPDPRWFVGGVGLLLVLGISDSLSVLMRAHWPAIAYLLHWGILYLLVLMFVAVIVRLLDALRVAEEAQHRLGLALAERTRELTAEFALRREAESARMLAEERQRIMRDMHDGVGGQLVALMTQVRGGALEPHVLAAEIQRSLDELRLMIDSLDPACADLSVALGMLRRRSEAFAGTGAARLRWRTAHLPDLPAAPPSTVLHVLRILQEAIANALKHAAAANIEVEAEWRDGRLCIRVRDDGGGGLREGAGRGLVHMRERAAAIGAELRLDSGADGSCVELDLPL